MSVVAGLVSGKKVYLAAESMTNDPDDGTKFETILSPKVFEWEGFVYGVVGDVRVGDVIYAAFEPPDINPDFENDYCYMATDFVAALRECLKEHGVKTEGDHAADWEILVGHNGVLYIVDCEFAVMVPKKTYHSIGSGRDPAFGSLAATSAIGQSKSPEERVTKAVGAACLRRADCGGEIIVKFI